MAFRVLDRRWRSKTGIAVSAPLSVRLDFSRMFSRRKISRTLRRF